LANAATRASEYQWASAHGDDVLLDAGDNGSIPIYRQTNPSITLIRYVLNWTVIRPGSEPDNTSTAYYRHMQQWYASHTQYQLENAFLHDASQCSAATKSAACRVTFKIWNSPRWALNPADPGARAYQRARLAEVAADADALFFDEHGSGDMTDHLGDLSLVEFPNFAAYQNAMVSWIGDLRAALAPKKIFLNTATYATAWDAQLIGAAGGAHAEGMNNPFRADLEQRWTFVEQMVQAGNTIEFVPGGDTPPNYTAGASASAEARRKLFQLASYDMIVPATPDLLQFNWGPDWTTPYSTQWYKALEVNIGHPTTARHIAADGTDPAGHHYRVWAREFTNGIVFVRPVIEWSSQVYGDQGALTITLPPGDTYLPVNTDGTVGAPTDRVTLRTAEAAIVLRQSRMSAVTTNP
jgi:hypothetical protein